MSLYEAERRIELKELTRTYTTTHAHNSLSLSLSDSRCCVCVCAYMCVYRLATPNTKYER